MLAASNYATPPYTVTCPSLRLVTPDLPQISVTNNEVLVGTTLPKLSDQHQGSILQKLGHDMFGGDRL
jgi:hypothetical protein